MSTKLQKILFALIILLSSFAEHAHAQTESSLDWLNGFLTCDELIQEIKTRYRSLGSYSELASAKKRELDYVLDVACGPRFSHCKFKSCVGLRADSGRKRSSGEKLDVQNRASKEQTVSKEKKTDLPNKRLEQSQSLESLEPGSKAEQEPVEAEDVRVGTAKKDVLAESANALEGETLKEEWKHEIGMAVEREMKRRYKEFCEERQLRIDMALEKEQKAKAQWLLMGNPDEQQVIESRREAVRSRREHQVEEESSGSFSYKSSSGQSAPSHRRSYRKSFRRKPKPSKTGSSSGKSAPKSISF